MTRPSVLCRTSCVRGQVRATGLSTFPGDLIVEAQWNAERRCRERFVCEQPPYSSWPGHRGRVLPPAGATMGVIVWIPRTGLVTGRYRKDSPLPRADERARMPSRYDPKRLRWRPSSSHSRPLLPAGRRRGVSLGHLALSFVLTHPTVTSAIIGPRTMEADDRRPRGRRRRSCPTRPSTASTPWWAPASLSTAEDAGGSPRRWPTPGVVGVRPPPGARAAEPRRIRGQKTPHRRTRKESAPCRVRHR